MAGMTRLGRLIDGHTPGPWRLGADLIHVHPYWIDEGGNSTSENFHRNGYAKTIATVGKEYGDWRDISQQVADTRLIAAAPELLEALRECHDIMHHCTAVLSDSDCAAVAGTMSKACEAIAKAQGMSAATAKTAQPVEGDSPPARSEGCAQ